MSQSSAQKKLKELVIEYCVSQRAQKLLKLISRVPKEQRFELLSAKPGTALTEAAYRGHTKFCVTLLRSLPSCDRAKLANGEGKSTAVHQAANRGHWKTLSAILSCLKTEEQLQLLFCQDESGETALHHAARDGNIDTVRALLGFLKPEQQLKLLSVQNKSHQSATQVAAEAQHMELEKILSKSQQKGLSFDCMTSKIR